MTCIVGLVHEGNVYIGGDSAGVAGLDLTIRADQKVWRSGEFVYGFTTSFRMGQLLRYKFDPPEQLPSQQTEEYMVGPFIDGVRRCLKDGGWLEAKNNQETGGRFLVGYRSRLFVIDSDFQVGETVDQFAAVGCGQAYAIGSLATSEGTARSRVKQALEVASRFSVGVRGPFTVEVTS